MLSHNLACMQPSLGLEASCPDTTRQGDQIGKPVTPTRDAYPRAKSQSKTVYHTETTPRSGTKVPGQTPQIEIKKKLKVKTCRRVKILITIVATKESDTRLAIARAYLSSEVAIIGSSGSVTQLT